MDLTSAQTDALRIAEQLIEAGIPVFAAPPCPGETCSRPGHRTGKHEYDLPAKWQLTVPSKRWLETWQPGWALGAVGGHMADFLDSDPRNGGDESIAALESAGQMPRVFGVQATPSGGLHYVISPLFEREANAFMPGLDYQGGEADGKGRAFVWIAPTVRRAKVEPYQPVEYRWLQEPDLDYLKDFESDDSIEGLRERLHAVKVRAPGNERRQDMEHRSFTEQEARQFCSITLERLEQADIGSIETAANNAACQLSHFVPEFWSEEFAYAVLWAALGETKYDPDHPASGWTADKFHDVIAGVQGRAPADWEARRKPESVDEVAPALDAVDALIAEMRSPADIMLQPPPRALVKGLLNLDSESWIIGEPGSKKSFVATDIAAHVAAGRSWQGLAVHAGPVVMIVAEGGGGLGPRLKAWEMQNDTPMAGPIHILTRPVQAANLEAWAVLREACRRLAPVLVVIDTQARVTVGLEENSAKEMGVYIEAVRSIREATGACVLTVHHTGRRGGDARGSSAIDGAQHTELKVEVDAKSSLRGKLSSEKQKDMALGPDVDLVFKIHTVGVSEDGDEITSLALVSSRLEKAAGTGDEPVEVGQEVSVPEPQGWTVRLYDHNRGENVRRILTIIQHVGGENGVKQSDVLRILLGRWYDGRPMKAKRGGHLDPETWTGSWTTAVDLRTASGDKIIEKVQGVDRYWIHPDVLSELG